jgi:hypothetical protein
MHISQLHKVVEQGDISLEFVSEKGELVRVPQAKCTSFHSKGKTLNIRLFPSEEVRTVRRATITKLNGKEIYL